MANAINGPGAAARGKTAPMGMPPGREIIATAWAGRSKVWTPKMRANIIWMGQPVPPALVTDFMPFCPRQPSPENPAEPKD